ncbi:MAG: hypothetical protein ACAI34_13505, partial [Verrucomicrobium sp.]
EARRQKDQEDKQGHGNLWLSQIPYVFADPGRGVDHRGMWKKNVTFVPALEFSSFPQPPGCPHSHGISIDACANV